MFRRFVCCFLGLTAWGAFAADAVYVGTNPNEANPFEHPEQWQDNRLPQDGDNASFSDTFGGNKGIAKFNFANANMFFNILTGAPRIEFTLAANKTVKINDPSGVMGAINFGRGSRLQVPLADATVQKVYVDGVGVLENSNAATLNELYGAGILEKQGAGNLTVKGLGGGRLRIRATQGSLTLGAHPKAERSVEDLLALAAFHVDANVAESLVKDGASVSEWHDVRGDGYPYAAVPDGFAAPQLEDDAFSGGKRLSFGEFVETKTDADKARCRAMVWSSAINGVRAAFIVMADTKDPGFSRPFFFGHTSDFPMHRGDNRVLLSRGFANMDVQTGRIWNNGSRVNGEMIVNVGTLQVIAFKPDNAISLETFSRDRTGNGGGVLIGEALVFTEDLSEAECRVLNDYLTEKWLKACGSPDVGGVTLGEGVDLRAEGDVRVGFVETTGKTLVKRGAGTLTVDALAGKAQKVDVRGGAVKFGAAAAKPSADRGIAANSRWHFDASDADSLELETVNGTNFVTRWHDAEDHSRGTVDERSAYNVPFVAANALNGKPYVSFGEFWSSGERNPSCARLHFPEDGPAWLMEGFMVVRDVEGLPEKGSPFYLGHTGAFPLHRGQFVSKVPLIDGGNADPCVTGGDWSVDGVRVDPTACACGDAFHVIHFSFAKPVNANLMGGDRNIPCRIGGVCVAEMALYAHNLTDAEVRDTEAHLMKKWLDREHPAAIGQGISVSMNFDGVEPLVETDQDITLDSVTGSGELVKTGSGSLSLGALGTSALNVREGRVAFAPMADRSAFHVDASAPGSIVSDADGILQWNDVRGAGYPSASAADAAERPTLVDDATSGLKFIDFGEFDSTSYQTPYMTWSQGISVKEVVIVGGDHDDNHTSAFFIGDTGGFPWHRGGAGEIYNDGWSGGVEKGEQAMCTYDGEIVDGTRQMIGSGLHVISLRMKDNQTFRTFARDRSFCRTGGVKLAEVLVFTEYLSDAERVRIVSNLRAKWQKIASTGITLDSVTLARGTQVDFNGESVRIGSLAGGGTVAAGGLEFADGSELVIGIDGEGVWDKIAVDGPVTFAGGGTVKVTVPDLVDIPTVVTVPVLTATSVTATTPKAWKAAVTPADRYAVRVIFGETSVSVRIRPRGGLTVIVR